MRNNLKNVAGVRNNAEMSRKRQNLLWEVLYWVIILVVNLLVMAGIFFGIPKLIAWIGFGIDVQLFMAAMLGGLYLAMVLVIGSMNDDYER